MEEMVAILGVFGALILPVAVGGVLFYRLFKGRHEERMAMIAQGFDVRTQSGPERKPNRYPALRNGLLMIGLAVGMLVGVWLDPYISSSSDWLSFTVPAFTILFGGLAFVVYFFLSRKMMRKEAKEDRAEDSLF